MFVAKTTNHQRRYHYYDINDCQRSLEQALLFVLTKLIYPVYFPPFLFSHSTQYVSPYHIWFQVECEVDHAPPDRSFSIACAIFSSKVVQLGIDNPCQEMLILKVSISVLDQVISPQMMTPWIYMD